MKINHEIECPKQGEGYLCLCVVRYCESLREDRDKRELELKATRDEALEIIRDSKGVKALDVKDFEKFNNAVQERMKI